MSVRSARWESTGNALFTFTKQTQHWKSNYCKRMCELYEMKCIVMNCEKKVDLIKGTKKPDVYGAVTLWYPDGVGYRDAKSCGMVLKWWTWTVLPSRVQVNKETCVTRDCTVVQSRGGDDSTLGLMTSVFSVAKHVASMATRKCSRDSRTINSHSSQSYL